MVASIYATHQNYLCKKCYHKQKYKKTQHIKSYTIKTSEFRQSNVWS